MARQIEVIKPGLFTTVQDLGRRGYQQYGIVVAGAMDPFSLQVANILVGNARNTAGLEVTLYGPELLFHEKMCIAICGADLGAVIVTSQGRGGQRYTREAPLWTSFEINKGEVLKFTTPVTGSRAYVAFAGGLDVPAVLGSRSTYVKASMGGLNGRALQQGDRIDVGNDISSHPKKTGRILVPDARPKYDTHATVKVILGPQDHHFTTAGLHTFFNAEYTVTNQSDRMGSRLIGPVIEHRSSADVISDAIAFGSIQVPADGHPVLLLADRQTTGGYAKIATVISSDLPKVGQLKPGDTVSFQAISIEEAHRLFIEMERLLRMIQII